MMWATPGGNAIPMSVSAFSNGSMQICRCRCCEASREVTRTVMTTEGQVQDEICDGHNAYKTLSSSRGVHDESNDET